ncbi:hypothetical protein HRI_002217300 [Hibiscus trionum]|uniref:Uncharacterized protein n=1 Tax=Hibiscus trionum TaxID=183268 RepID=A0A9W7I0U1_HIBTR|nr:hypothetical protein HRI_002217300 [Hibiscus trionum]
MAEVLDDAEFFLPPQFLTQDDFLMDKKDDFGLELDGSNPLFHYDFHFEFEFSLDLINFLVVLCWVLL